MRTTQLVYPRRPKALVLVSQSAEDERKVGVATRVGLLTAELPVAVVVCWHTHVEPGLDSIVRNGPVT